MRRATALLMSLLLMCCMASCSMSSDDYSEEASDESAAVTESGNEYSATVDQDSLSCSVEYLGTTLDVDEEEENVYELIDAGDSIECEYWFPVDASQPVTIQILNPDGEDTVMAELTFPSSET